MTSGSPTGAKAAQRAPAILWCTVFAPSKGLEGKWTAATEDLGGLSESGVSRAHALFALRRRAEGVLVAAATAGFADIVLASQVSPDQVFVTLFPRPSDRCPVCRAKLTLVRKTIVCRCDNTFCARHFKAEDHECPAPPPALELLDVGKPRTLKSADTLGGQCF